MTLTDRVHDLELDVAKLQQWAEVMSPIAEKRGLDVEALKLSQQETKVTQRLTIAVGGMLGTLLVSLVIFAATRA